MNEELPLDDVVWDNLEFLENLDNRNINILLNI